ncbi:hypothetical protein [Capnocytophaga leadbetteri]|jgi:hypothetical protein|uniref:hypothetical protein n=1 Tax=Capnocytophaga leadbetteri TaxID=327575 RepID=UPI0028E381AA|nr:hypothetical protein [Capnocytophaga leadbetteri]
MKNTLKLMAVAFAMFAFSTNATAATVKAADMNQSVVLDQDGNANAKVEKADQDGGKKECKKDGKKSCCKKDAKEDKKSCDKNADKKSCDKKDGKKSCCKKGGEKPADKDAK